MDVRALGGKVSRRLKVARDQPAGLTVPYLLAPLDLRAPRLMAPGRVARVAGTSRRTAAAALREALEGPVPAHVTSEWGRWAAETGREPLPGAIAPAEGAVLHALVRLLRPEVVVETGTANGVSSAYLLDALERNARGRLISVDLPFTDHIRVAPSGMPEMAPANVAPNLTAVAEGRVTGWLIPDALRGRWELRSGDARELLEPALRDAGPVGLFFHDSLHVREHMRFEFEAAWGHLAPGGVLASHDVYHQDPVEPGDVLPAFARHVRRPFHVFGKLGLIRAGT